MPKENKPFKKFNFTYSGPQRPVSAHRSTDASSSNDSHKPLKPRTANDTEETPKRGQPARKSISLRKPRTVDPPDQSPSQTAPRPAKEPLKPLHSITPTELHHYLLTHSSSPSDLAPVDIFLSLDFSGAKLIDIFNDVEMHLKAGYTDYKTWPSGVREKYVETFLPVYEKCTGPVRDELFENCRQYYLRKNNMRNLERGRVPGGEDGVGRFGGGGMKVGMALTYL